MYRQLFQNQIISIKIYSLLTKILMSSTITSDEFLQQKNIQIQRSSFLANHYARKAFALRDSYNPRDIYGSRLSYHWQPGNNIFSVTKKRIIQNTTYLLNPDTYSKQTIQKFKMGMLKYKVQIVSGIIVIGLPLLVIYPLLRPRLKKIKRQFLFQYYLQSQMLARKLETSSTKIPVYEVQQIIKKAQSKIKL